MRIIKLISEETIKKNDIIAKITLVNEKAKAIVECLYDYNSEYLAYFHDYNASEIREIIEENRANKTRNIFPMLQPLKGETGVYLFFNSENIPIYVGVGGIGKNDDLYVRVRNECKIHSESYSEDTGATLSINIKKELELLNQYKDDNQIKSLINSFRIIAINLGKMNVSSNQDFANYLESLLIILFRPQYNRRG